MIKPIEFYIQNNEASHHGSLNEKANLQQMFNRALIEESDADISIIMQRMRDIDNFINITQS